MNPPPLTVAAADPLGRRIHSEKHAKKAKRAENPSVDFRVFADNAPAISVDRLDHVSDSDMTVIADANPPPGRSFYGWAVISAEHASENGRQVHPTPTDQNPFHADIAFPTQGQVDDEQRKAVAVELAAGAAWRSRA